MITAFKRHFVAVRGAEMPQHPECCRGALRGAENTLRHLRLLCGDQSHCVLSLLLATLTNIIPCFFLPSLPIFPFSPEAGAGVSLEEGAGFLSFHELSELMQALPGFLMLLTGEGKFLYLSESVSEHLGHSMVSLHTVSALAVQQSRVWDS